MVNKITGDLCRSYERAMRGSLVVDIEVRLDLKSGGGQGLDWGVRRKYIFCDGPLSSTKYKRKTQ